VEEDGGGNWWPALVEAGGPRPVRCAGVVGRGGERGRGPERMGHYGAAGVGWPERIVKNFISFKFINKLEFAMVQNTSSLPQKISNKIWN
jgi:hypothetical protein